MINPEFEQHVQALADYLPNGRLFEAKSVQDSNFRQLLRGLAGELFNAQGYLVTLNNEYLPDLTTLFLDEWERALQIPDDCFPSTGTVSERRRDVLVKLAALGVQTAEDFEILGTVFGTTIQVIPLIELSLPPYDVPFFPVEETRARFIFVVVGSGLDPVLECLIRKQAQANGGVLFLDTI